ncbi:MAG: ABC transporter ATP-binding protein [Cyclobacteriaceae bacterium]|nr:ABC transporter ATP-binding protein [Cyclobacteriaceae bacterium]
MLKATSINKNFGDLQVLNNVDMDIQRSQVVSIVGASGAGKSTLLHILGTLDKADSGSLFISNTEVSKLDTDGLADFRNKKLGFVFQFHNLLPEFTALENVCIPSYMRGGDKSQIDKKGVEMLSRLGLGSRAQHKPSELSGGEQQRVAVARALINQPEIIFADEPSGNLDSKNAADLHELFFQLRDDFGQTFVIVTHNEELAEMTDIKYEIKDGSILGTARVKS